MHRTQAWELLQDSDYSSRLTMDGFHRLLRQAGYTEAVAHKAAMQRGWDRLSAGEVM